VPSSFWHQVIAGVRAGERVLLVAEEARGICGTVQLVLAQMENQPHRADVSKLLVHRRARRPRRRRALMRAAEDAAARLAGRSSCSIPRATRRKRLYDRLGWRRVGAIPGYALMPRGGPCATTVYYRSLASFVIAALVFDMDGLMLDTEPIYRASWQRAAAEIGWEITDHAYEAFLGRRTEDAEAELARMFGRRFHSPDSTTAGRRLARDRGPGARD
jgi:hypothetical protein